jgi:hypothetical protein
MMHPVFYFFGAEGQWRCEPCNVMNHELRMHCRECGVLRPSPFRLSQTYKTKAGEEVKFVKVHNEGTWYETMEDENGVNRYTRRDFGRVTGRDSEHPGNVEYPVA